MYRKNHNSLKDIQSKYDRNTHFSLVHWSIRFGKGCRGTCTQPAFTYFKKTKFITSFYCFLASEESWENEFVDTVFRKAMTSTRIIHSFSKCGLYPFDGHKLLDVDFLTFSVTDPPCPDCEVRDIEVSRFVWNKVLGWSTSDVQHEKGQHLIPKISRNIWCGNFIITKWRSELQHQVPN